jgi:hypothetical protein
VDDCIHDLLHGHGRVDLDETRDSSHPLSLVGGVAARPCDEPLQPVLGRKRRELLEPESLRGRSRQLTRPSGPRFHHGAALEHRDRPLPDAALEFVRRHGEAGHERGAPCLPGPETSAAGRRSERRARIRELERANDASAVVEMDRSRGLRVAGAELRVGAAGIRVVPALPVLACPFCRSGRNAQVRERCPQVEPGAPRDHRTSPLEDELVDLRMGKARVLADGHLFAQGTDTHEAGRPRRLVREDREPPVHLERVG